MVELYLSDFTAFLEIWIGSILLLLYKSVSLINNNENNNENNNGNNNRISLFVESYAHLSCMFNEFVNRYQGFFPNNPWCPDHLTSIENSNLSLERITRRYRYIALTAIVYGLLILLYIGIEKNYKNIYPSLLVTDIFVLYFYILSISKIKFLTNISIQRYLFLFLFTLVIFVIFVVHFQDFLTKPLITYINYLGSPRTSVTILTLFTCCFSVFIILYARFTADRYQVNLMNQRIERLDSEINNLIEIWQDGPDDIDISTLSPQSRRFITDHSNKNQRNKAEIIQNLIIERVHEFIMTFGD